MDNLTQIKKQRSLAVFISSTFEDMKAERDMMMKRVFPQIRKLCEQRGVIWNEIDLRWGITDEQKEKGEVLPICLRRIDDCRPVFIGLLGERYGWVPEEKDIPEELVKQEPWLETQIGSSITELEILHGVLNHTDQEGYSFFYLRDAAYSNNNQVLIEQTKGDKEKLNQLKKRIYEEAEKQHLHAQPYETVKNLEELLLTDLTTMVETLFPIDEQVDPAVQEDMEHETYARNRARSYIERSGEEEELNRFIEETQTVPFLVRGESGLGKSSFLAHWGMMRQKAHHNNLILMHFVGANDKDTDVTLMIRSIIRRLSAKTGIEFSFPETAEECQGTFTEALLRVADHIDGKLIIILDGINQMEQAGSGFWLPSVLPPNVKFIIGTLDGPVTEVLKRKSWDQKGIEIQGLDIEERKQLIRRYLSTYGKELKVSLVEKIAEAPQTKSPLYLRFLLDEIRLYGKHEELEMAIDQCLQSASIDRLLLHRFERLTEEFKDDRSGIVRESLLLIYASKKGLSEDELRELLGDEEGPLPSAIWSPFYLSLESAFLTRSGLIHFSHDFVRKAVEQMYVENEQDKQAAYERLITYFSKKDEERAEDEQISKRVVEELPWYLFQTKQWKVLSVFLAKPEVLEQAWEQEKYDVLRYWSEIEKNRQSENR